MDDVTQEALATAAGWSVGRCIRIIIPLRPVTGNLARRTTAYVDWKLVNKRGNPVAKSLTYVTEEAWIFRAWVAAYALDEIERSGGWEIPEACMANVTAYNINQDRSNLIKEADDALEGLLWRRDSEILDGRIKRLWTESKESGLIYNVSAVDRAFYDCRVKPKVADQAELFASTPPPEPE